MNPYQSLFADCMTLAELEAALRLGDLVFAAQQGWVQR